MKKYSTEHQPEKGKKLKFSVLGETFEGTFNGILFKTGDKSYSVLRYDIDWEYV